MAAASQPKASARKLSRQHRPAGLSLEAWQRALRRQFGREQSFRWKNIGSESMFSPEVLDRALQTVGTLLERLRRGPS